MPPQVWSGRAVTNARRHMALMLPAPCAKCGKPITEGQRWIIGHRIPRAIRPDLMWDPTNWQHEHGTCSERSGGEVRREKNLRAAVQKKSAIALGDNRFFGVGGAQVAPRPLPSLSPSAPIPPSSWADLAEALPWLGDLAEIPPDAQPPRFMTSPHPDAIGTYGPDFVAWLAAHPGIHPRVTEGLRWWQLVVAYRLLEHDDGGRLVWRNALVTVARQVGKSWLVRALVLWRICQGERFGEVQTIIHIAHRLPTASEVWRPAARWAMGQRWHVRWANGEQVIEAPEGGRWLIRAATDGVGVGFALSALVVDEGWMVSRAVVEAADGALAESASPQLLLISTAGDSASDLFGTYRGQALAQLTEPSNTMLAEWSAPAGAAIEDRAGWVAASPHWSARREGEILDKLGKQTELEFRQNFLNQWVDVAHGRAEEAGLPAFTVEEWEALGTYTPATPVAAAVEAWFGAGVAVALAAPDGEGHVGVSVFLASSVAEAAGALDGIPVVLVGKSLAADPALRELPVRAVGGTSRQAVGGLRRLVAEGTLRHDGGADLTRQVLAVRYVPGPEGPRVRSNHRIDAIKSAVWAVEEAQVAPEAPGVF